MTALIKLKIIVCWLVIAWFSSVNSMAASFDDASDAKELGFDIGFDGRVLRAWNIVYADFQNNQRLQNDEKNLENYLIYVKEKEGIIHFRFARKFDRSIAPPFTPMLSGRSIGYDIQENKITQIYFYR